MVQLDHEIREIESPTKYNDFKVLQPTTGIML